MSANPKPNVAVNDRRSQDAIVAPDPRRPSMLPNLLEMQTGMIRIFTPESVTFPRELANRDGKAAIFLPEIAGGITVHLGSFLALPALYSAIASRARRSRGPPSRASRSISRSHCSARRFSIQSARRLKSLGGSVLMTRSISCTVLMTPDYNTAPAPRQAADATPPHEPGR